MKLSVTHRDILHIAIPSVLSNITVPLLGLVDLTIVGHLGSPAYIGAISVGGTLFNMIYWIFAFLRMGTTGLTAQAYGRADRTEVRLLLARSGLVGALISVALVALQYPLGHWALDLMNPTAEVRAHALLYFRICIWGAPAMLGQYSLTGWFLGLQQARYPLYVALWQNVVNIAASLAFVYGLHLGVGGVALGTLLAQYAALTLSLWLARRIYRRSADTGEPLRWSEICRGEALRRFFGVNRDIFLRTLCLVSVTLYFTSAGARSGDLVLAVNALLMQFFILYSYFMDGIAFAGEALSGRFAGAGQPQAFRSMVRGLFLWGGGIAACATAVYALGGSTFVGWLTNEPQVQALAADFLPWMAVIPAAGLAAFVWDGVFIGLTATRQMLLSMATATATFFGLYLAFESAWGNHALWLAFVCYLAVRGAVQSLLYRGVTRRTFAS